MMKSKRILLACLAFGCAIPALGAGKADSGKLTSVYLLAHVGAILDICAASPEAAAFPAEKSREIGDLSARLAALVRSIGTHYRDKELYAVYESTKANMAADEKLRHHVKSDHQNCGERTLGDMRTYVADNEAMIGKAIEKSRLAAPSKPAPSPAR